WTGERWQMTHPSLFDTAGRQPSVFACWEPIGGQMIVGWVDDRTLKLRTRDGADWPEVALPVEPVHMPMSATTSEGVLVQICGMNEQHATLLITGTDVAVVGLQAGGPLTIAYDEQRAQVIGIDVSSATWRWDDDHWTELAVVGPKPNASVMCFDHDRQRLVAIRIRELLAFDGERWDALSPPVSTGASHWGHLVHDRDRHVMVSVGGQRGAAYTRDTVLLVPGATAMTPAPLAWVAPIGGTGSAGLVDGRFAFIDHATCTRACLSPDGSYDRLELAGGDALARPRTPHVIVGDESWVIDAGGVVHHAIAGTSPYAPRTPPRKLSGSLVTAWDPIHDRLVVVSAGRGGKTWVLARDAAELVELCATPRTGRGPVVACASPRGVLLLACTAKPQLWCSTLDGWSAVPLAGESLFAEHLCHDPVSDALYAIGPSVWRLAAKGFETLAAAPVTDAGLGAVGVDPVGRRLVWIAQDGDTYALPI
ncbi:MAG: hypothetical protein ABI867_33320, partial [Kofleriaceae bacterium]